jgi:hypothetical protein
LAFWAVGVQDDAEFSDGPADWLAQSTEPMPVS